MKARLAKKMLKQVLSGQIEVLRVLPSHALLVKFDVRRFTAEHIKRFGTSLEDAIGIPVVLSPKEIEISAVERS